MDIFQSKEVQNSLSVLLYLQFRAAKKNWGNTKREKGKKAKTQLNNLSQNEGLGFYPLSLALEAFLEKILYWPVRFVCTCGLLNIVLRQHGKM